MNEIGGSRCKGGANVHLQPPHLIGIVSNLRKEGISQTSWDSICFLFHFTREDAWVARSIAIYAYDIQLEQVKGLKDRVGEEDERNYVKWYFLVECEIHYIFYTTCFHHHQIWGFDRPSLGEIYKSIACLTKWKLPFVRETPPYSYTLSIFTLSSKIGGRNWIHLYTWLQQVDEEQDVQTELDGIGRTMQDEDKVPSNNSSDEEIPRSSVNDDGSNFLTCWPNKNS